MQIKMKGNHLRISELYCMLIQHEYVTHNILLKKNVVSE